MTEPGAPAPSTRCRCGYTSDDKIVVPRTYHSALAWTLMGFGISSCPRRVDLVCPVCHFTFASITDPAKCERYRYK